MIKHTDKQKTFKKGYYINTGRPDLFSDDDFNFWDKIHSYVKECDYPIVVSGAFYFIEEYLTKRECYGGGEMQYMFWFDNQENLNSFTDFFNNATE